MSEIEESVAQTSPSSCDASHPRELDRRSPLVLHVRVVTGRGGGPDKTIINSPAFLEPLGYRAACAYIHPAKDPGFELLRKRAEHADAPLFSIPDRGPVDWKVFQQLVRICRQENVAIWHGHDYKSNVLGLLIKRFHQMKLVTTVHGWVKHTRRTPLYYGFDRASLPYYDDVICVSEDLHERCLDIGVKHDRCHLVRNAIDTNVYDRTRSVDKKPGPSAGVVIGGMGRLSEEKGFAILIEAASRLIQQGRDIRVFIAGEGELLESLSLYARELGIRDRVELVGHVDDPREFYKSIDLFVLSSLREGLPNVLLEAMAMEVPIVATRIAGVPKLIDDGVNGILVEPGSAGDLVHGITQLLDDATLAREFASSGRQAIVSQYSFEQRMRRVASIYDKLLCRTSS